jgi:hypothetical protein
MPDKDKEVKKSRYKPGQLSGVETALVTKLFQEVGDISVDDLPYSEEFEKIIHPTFQTKMRPILLSHLFKEILYLRKKGLLVTKTDRSKPLREEE